MPLMDHFRPPLSTQRHWESFHAAWAGALADSLNDPWLPEGYFAEEQVHPTARRGDDDRIDLWPSVLKLGEKLPVVPLAISRDCSVPVDFEATYSDACRRRRLA